MTRDPKRPEDSLLSAVVRPPVHSVAMERQLVLIETTSQTHRLDEQTRRIGRQGLAAAREALRHAQLQAQLQAQAAA